MKKKIEQLLSGKFEYDQPPLMFSKDKIRISLKPGETVQDELYLGTEDNDGIQGYITSSSRRLVPGIHRFSGTTVRLPYGADGVGMEPGETVSGCLCVTSSVGEYKIPFEIHAETEEVLSFGEKVKDMDSFLEICRRDFREGYRIFTDKNFVLLLSEANPEEKALYAGLSRQPVTYQHLEEFLIGMKLKDSVTISLKTTGAEFYEVQESVQESLDIHRSGWGHLRLDVEARGEFLEPERHVVTGEDFIGSTCRISYVIHADRLKQGDQRGKIIIRSPYQELVYQITASKDAKVSIDVRREEKRRRLEIVQDYIEYREGRQDQSAWTVSARYILDQLKQSGCLYPEYQFYEAYIDHVSGLYAQSQAILKKFADKVFSRNEIEMAGVYLYLCTLTGLYKDQAQAVWKLKNFYRRKEDSFLLFWLVLQTDTELKNNPSRALFMMEELYEKGCTNPLLYLEAWQLVCRDMTLLHRLSPFWMQVFCFAAKQKLLTEELVMRLAYLSGYEKEFHGCLYRALSGGYRQFLSDEVLEAVCKYIIKGNPRRPEYFQWFSLAVERGLRITRLYEYYVETMDISYQRELPKSLLMYFAYNDDSLCDDRKAFVYASVIANREKSPRTFEEYKKSMEQFAKKAASEGRMDENYAVVYQEFLFDPKTKEEADLAARSMLTYRLYFSDPKIRQVAVRHSQMAEEEVYPCVRGVVYLRIYTEDAVILFQDDKQRRYVSTVPCNLKKMTDEENAVQKAVELGAEDFGTLLHYCSVNSLDDASLKYFQRLAASSECTEEFKRSLRKQILDYYAAAVRDGDLDRYLTEIDYREYVQADRKTLLTVLIDRRMFRQAFALVEEYGYEGLPVGSLLKLTSRMILKSDMQEDDELIALASEVYSSGKYDEVILQYLMRWRQGPVDDLISVWKSAKGFDMDTCSLEEKILSLLMFTSDYRKEGESVLYSYIRQPGKERITGAYLTQVSYGVFVKEYTMSRFIRERLEYAYRQHWPVPLICRLALLKDISKDRRLKPEYEETVKSILTECAAKSLAFGFFRRFPPELLSLWQLDDKTIVECHAHPEARVTLFYVLDTGLGDDAEYKSEPLRNVYQGIFTRAFTLFYGETLRYYFRIEQNGNEKRTAERTVTMKKAEGTPGSKYQMLNQMLSARRLDKDTAAAEDLKRYLRQEQYVREMFTIEKETGE